MSRVIVKNLPSNATDQTVRDHFSVNQHVTDVKIMRKKDGTSRRFAFVGYKSGTAAEDAVTYFNGTFLNTSRLNVELAKDLKDESLISQHDRRKRQREIADREKERAVPRRKKTAAEPKDEKLQEYLKVMKPQSATAMWINDETQSVKAKKPELAQAEDESEDDIVDMRTIKSTAEISEDTNDAFVPDNMVDEETEAASETDEKVAAPESDLDWLRQRQIRMKDTGEKFESRIETEQEPKPSIQEEVEEQLDNSSANRARRTGRLFLRNLSYEVTSSDLSTLFSDYPLEDVHVPRDAKADRPKGFAYVHFVDPEDAVSALNLDGTIFQGRLLHIIPAEKKREQGLDEFDIKNLPLKKQQLLKKKAQAAKAQFSWNSLYLNQDAVLETVAAQLGITKAEMLDPHSSSSAVKKTLAESSVLQKVQEYFRSKGVDLQKFNKRETTDKVILVKNIPFGTSLDEIKALFAEHGELVRVLMPPEGGLAIVQYESATEARKAFTKLSFRRLGDSVLYLQKAPVGVLDESAGATTKKAQQETTKVASASDLLAVDTKAADVPTTSVFVKNLNFGTTIEALTALFKPLDGFVRAQIQSKPDSKSPGSRISMGFGFVEFRTSHEANVAVNAINGSDLDGHKLELKLSHRGQDAAPSKPKGANGTKIIIKNVPFETTKKDIVDLFGTFGQLRGVRLPRKFNKQARGFAFADFTTAKEAQNAMESLQGAHLLGRRLVMQYAAADSEDPEEDIARMEAKVKSQVSAEKISKMRVHGQAQRLDLENEEDAF